MTPAEKQHEEAVKIAEQALREVVFVPQARQCARRMVRALEARFLMIPKERTPND